MAVHGLAYAAQQTCFDSKWMGHAMVDSFVASLGMKSLLPQSSEKARGGRRLAGQLFGYVIEVINGKNHSVLFRMESGAGRVHPWMQIIKAHTWAWCCTSMPVPGWVIQCMESLVFEVNNSQPGRPLNIVKARPKPAPYKEHVSVRLTIVCFWGDITRTCGDRGSVRTGSAFFQKCRTPLRLGNK